MKEIKAFKDFILNPLRFFLFSLAAFAVVFGVFLAFYREYAAWIIASFSLLAGLIIVLLFLAFNRDKRAQAEALKEREEEIRRLKEEKLEALSTAFNVHEIRQTLELAVFEAKTSIYRIMDQKEEKKDRVIRYIGVMKMDIKGKYGVNMSEMICSVGEGNVLYLENINPGFLSFSERVSEWVLSECIEQKKGIMRLLSRWVSGSAALTEFARRKEEFRNALEREIEKKGPMELDFLESSLKLSIEKNMRMILGHFGFELRFGLPEKGVKVPLEAFLQNHGKYLGK